MQIDIITCLPRFCENLLEYSIIAKAQKADKVKIMVHNLRDYTPYSHGKVDDTLYGGAAGMLLMIEPIVNCIESIQAKTNSKEVIYMAPDGELLDQKMANILSLEERLIILCGHYKGIDERVREHFVTREISIGSYVISGGELAAMVLVDSIVRLIPGAISDETSALSDSFQDGLLAPPAYTRPADFRGMKVPQVLLSGNHKEIDEWSHEKSIERTLTKSVQQGVEKF